jgi:hypothetical protein
MEKRSGRDWKKAALSSMEREVLDDRSISLPALLPALPSVNKKTRLGICLSDGLEITFPGILPFPGSELV